MKMSSSKPSSRTWKLLLFSFTIFSHVFIGYTKNCVQNDQCSCTFDDGSGAVDISRIGTVGGDPLIKDVFAADNYAYSFNPCYPFTEGTCTNAAACQLDAVNLVYYNIGDANRVVFSYDGTDIIGTYTADDGQRQSIVTYKCDPSADPPQFGVSGETSTATYGFTITSSAACPSGAGPPGPSPTDGPSGPSGSANVSASVSTGWILTIVLVCLLAVYMVTGVAFNKAYRHESGRNLIPNVTFWTALPGLIKEGGRFAFAKVLRREYTPI